MSAKKKTPSRKRKTAKKKPRRNYRVQAVLAAAVMVAAVVAGLYIDGRLFRKTPSPPAPATAPASAYDVLEDVRVEVESLLLRNGASLEGIKDNLVADTLVFEVEGEFPSSYMVQRFRDRLKEISPRLRLFTDADRGRFRVELDRQVLCRVSFSAKNQPRVTGKRARVAIVMDDLGREMKTAKELVALEVPVTFSVLPGAPNAAKVATLAHRGRREVLVHIPMEPQGFPAINPGSDALFLSHSAEELQSRLTTFWRQVPYAVGGNNHMGSRFTEDAEAMATVLDFMRERALFFVDSRTSGRSVAHRLALESGVASASRDVFLDNDQDVAKIRHQIRKLANLAQRTGQAIGICHPYPETLEALRLESDALASDNIEVVPVSDLLVQSGS